MKQKCYIYTRVSTVRQLEGFSLEAQKNALKNYASYKDLDIVGEYCDEARSGHSINGRPEFMRLMDDIVSEKDNISYLLVFKLSRLGRNAADVLKTMQVLSDYDINIVSVNDAIDSSTQGGRLTLSILSAVAEIERENIKEQFAAALEQKRKNGGWPGGPVPYGYKVVDKELEVNEEEAKIVREIYKQYLKSDATIYSVTNYLNNNNTKFSSYVIQRQFNTDFVKRILEQPIYAGFYRHNYRSSTGKPVYEIKGYHMPLISMKDWDMVKEKRMLTEKGINESKRINILSGLVKCPICGRGLVGQCSKKKTSNNEFYKPIYSYICKAHSLSEGRKCSFNRHYNQDKVDNAVAEVVGELNSNDDFIKLVNLKMNENGELSEYKTMIKSLRKKYYSLQGLKRNLGKELDAIPVSTNESYICYEKIQTRIYSIYDEMDEIENEISDLEEKRKLSENSEKTALEMTQFIEDFSKVYSRMSREELKEYYRLFIEKIDLYEEKRRDGKILKSISFKIPIDDKKEVNLFDSIDKSSVSFEICIGEEDITSSEAKATYNQIKDYVLDRYDTKISNLYIGQIKSKYGIKERANYNISKKANAHVPKCPKEKEIMIVDALMNYKMLPKDTVVH